MDPKKKTSAANLLESSSCEEMEMEELKLASTLSFAKMNSGKIYDV